MKPKTEWTFSELQCHAKGIIEGIIIGTTLTVNIILFGYWIYLISC